jgi:uncharacterized protein YecE (DUF72 family)
MPNPFVVKNWYRKTPDNFRFTVKFPKVINSWQKVKNVENELEYFCESISGLGKKVLTLLLQLPPTLTIIEGLERLRVLTPVLDEIQICSRSKG